MNDPFVEGRHLLPPKLNCELNWAGTLLKLVHSITPNALSYSSFQLTPVAKIEQLPLGGDVGHYKRKSSIFKWTETPVGYQMSSRKELLLFYVEIVE